MRTGVAYTVTKAVLQLWYSDSIPSCSQSSGRAAQSHQHCSQSPFSLLESPQASSGKAPEGLGLPFDLGTVGADPASVPATTISADPTSVSRDHQCLGAEALLRPGL